MNGTSGDKGVLLLNRVPGHAAADDLERVLNKLLDRISEAEPIVETTEDSLFAFPTIDAARRFAEQLLSTLRATRHDAADAVRLVTASQRSSLMDPSARLEVLRREAMSVKPGVVNMARNTPPDTASSQPDSDPQVDEPKPVQEAPPPRPAPKPPSTAGPGPTTSWFTRTPASGAANRPNPFAESSAPPAKPTPAPVSEPEPATEPVSEAEPPPDVAPPEPEAETPSGIHKLLLVNPTDEPVERCAMQRTGNGKRLLICTNRRLTLGRSRNDADIVTWVMPRSDKNDQLSRMVSSVHCRLLLNPEAIMVRHLSSVNPTHLNSVRIDDPVPLPLDRPSVLTLSANFSLHLTPLQVPTDFASLSERWCGVMDEDGRRRWEWGGRHGIGGILIERRDGLAEIERYLWLLSSVALREDLTASEDGQGCGVALTSLPWVAIGNHGMSEGVRYGDHTINEGTLALLAADRTAMTPRGDLLIEAFKQDLGGKA